MPKMVDKIQKIGYKYFMEYNYKENQDKILNHLSQYKKNVLKIKKNGIYSKNLKEYTHILPKDKEIHNLIVSDYFMDLWNIIKVYKINLHKYFHHLNSSQAMCFNLFYPIIKENLLEIIMKNTNDDIIGWKFEYEPDKIERTNFDVFIQTQKLGYYFELKFTEQNFGSKIMNERSIQRYNEVYKEKMQIFKKVTPEIFYKNYQIFRNLSYIDKGIINFVFPKTRIDLDMEINTILEKHCDKKYLEKINIVYIEDILERALLINKFKEHYKIFSEKYIEWAYCA